MRDLVIIIINLSSKEAHHFPANTSQYMCGEILFVSSGNSQKLQGVMSGEQGGWSNFVIDFFS
jgi:hypothetical protein